MERSEIFSVKLRSIKDFVEMVDMIENEGSREFVDGDLTREIQNLVVEVVQPVKFEQDGRLHEWVTQAIAPGDESLAEERVKHILVRTGTDRRTAYNNLCDDIQTRQAVIFHPDYNPYGQECILACQILVRSKIASLIVYSRSCDMHFVFPMDVLAMGRILTWFVQKINREQNLGVQIGNIIFHIGSAHCYITRNNRDKTF